MTGLLKIGRTLDRWVSLIGKAAAWLAIPMMLIILFDVITRRFLVLGSTKLQELEWHIHGALFLLCFGFAYLKDAHVRIELVRDHLGARARAIIEVAGFFLCLLPLCILMMWYGWGFAERSYEQGEVSSALTGLSHRWIIKSFIMIGFAIVLLSGISVLIRCLTVLFGAPEEQREGRNFLAVGHHAWDVTPESDDERSG